MVDVAVVDVVVVVDDLVVVIVVVVVIVSVIISGRSVLCFDECTLSGEMTGFWTQTSS